MPSTFDVRSLSTLPPDALLSREELASWLKVTPRQIERWRVPRIALSRKVVRYRLGAVREWLQERALAD